MELGGKRILVGVTGGIAAYKAAELVRLLVGAGAEVRVVMTQGARAFVAPLTFQALSGHPVRSELLAPGEEAGMDHIALARWAQAVVVAPASAAFLARLAHGLAQDLLTTLCLATRAPLLLAPAMNGAMWEHPATQANAALLRGRGVRLLGPEAGPLACGEEGPGRMATPEALLQALAGLLGPRPLAGRRVLVTAGPTREPLDPVRYLGNRSSGRMGYALAQAAAEAGAEVLLVSGPVALPVPPGVRRVAVERAEEMRRAVLAEAPRCDLLLAAAAVADFAPEAAAAAKIKKEALGGEGLTLRLRPTPDIVAEVARLPRRPFLVAFAAETVEGPDGGAALEAAARAKLEAKGADLVAANRVGPGLGMEAEDNALLVVWPGGRRELPRAPKEELARRLMALVVERLDAQRAA
ncbi:MAG: bifunctional phosphopantothenoylcysteine decarboxylase/phosphopantothenate--cysteine ligase CoaBC [Gammaproteobacteria bacterium]|nr:MAG: bifunctional phosphopantothenoylcysteine decarboxylase/phosphopantothenate--cysteine ligase CoaBC [Gammaproteobacteria bacterium]